jgi:hypothetical protein
VGATGATGATGVGATGPTGPTGAAGNFIMGGSNGTVNLNAGPFLAPGRGSSATESDVQGIVPVATTFTHFYCSLSAAPAATATFTVRLNGTSQAGTCTLSTAQTTNNTTVSIPVTAGQLIDVQASTASGSNTRSASWGLAP